MPSEMLAQRMDWLASGMQARPVSYRESLSGRILRMMDSRWWRRNLRRSLRLENENIEHGAGHVRRNRQCYVTDHAMHVTAKRDKMNRLVLEALEVMNEQGQAFNLAEIVDRTVSNPKLRRGELMVRCRGFEEVADMLYHDAVFLTLTCPSRFHCFDLSGKPNPRWDAAGRPTPRDGQRYLNTVWKRIRAQWKRDGFHPYGFRVAEPHHDGCPHWHILLFAPKHHVGWFEAGRYIAGRADFGAGLLGVAGEHALADSGEERGAELHRFKVERVDRAKGTATGYIAKYICKNVDGIKQDGSPVGLDYASGKKATDAAPRVRTWASTHSIRQFQQVGGPSVTVWRELRRLAQDAQDPVCQLELFEGPRSAADRGLWGLFWFLQGGPEVARGNLTLRPFYMSSPEGRYGEEGKQVRGVVGRDEGGVDLIEVTRMHTWTVQPAGQAVSDAIQATHTKALHAALDLGFRDVPAWEQYIAEIVMGHASQGEADPDPASRSGEAASTWTGVNNCTDDDAAALRSDLLRGRGGFTDGQKGPEPPCNSPPMPQSRLSPS